MTDTTNDETRAAVRTAYARIAREGGSCACGPAACCPSGSVELGYSAEELAGAPDGADLGLGCGNPQAIAALQEGETVLDLGSGGGLDAFLAARQVGSRGHVIGVDMTPEMVSKARGNAAKVGVANVEFRLGEIERLPVADGSVDVVISNCVVNLSPDKAAVFAEAFRVLRTGGRLAIADVVATAALPEKLRGDMAAYSGCVAGAAHVDEVRAMLARAGFDDVRIEIKEATRAMMGEWFPGTDAGRLVASANIEARKGKAACCAPGCCA